MPLDEAIEALRSPEVLVRRQGVSSLLKSGQDAQKAIPTIVEIMEQHQTEVPFEPLVVLAELGPAAESAVPAIVKNLEKYAPNVQHNLLHVLVAIGPASQPAVPVLMRICASEDFHCRYLACRALGVIGPGAKPAVGLLIERLQSPSDAGSVRRNAAQALGRLGPEIAPEAVPALIRAMDDPLSPVRDEAVLALGNFGKLAEPAVPQLRTLVTQAHSPQRCKAASSLWQLTRDTQFVLPHMIEHLRVGNLEWEAAEVLGIMGPAAAPAVTALVTALEGDESRQIAAAEALGNIGAAARRAVPVLQQLLKSEDADIRQVAQQAIDKIQASR